MQKYVENVKGARVWPKIFSEGDTETGGEPSVGKCETLSAEGGDNADDGGCPAWAGLFSLYVNNVNNRQRVPL